MDALIQNASTYTDFQGLAALRAKAQQDQNAAVDQVAEQFEGMFLQLMLKEMRKTVPESEFFDTPGMKLYQDMQDQQIALDLAKSEPLGIGKMLRETLSRQGVGAVEQPAQKNPAGQSLVGAPSTAKALGGRERSFAVSPVIPRGMALDQYQTTRSYGAR